MKINHIYHGNALEVLRSLPGESISCTITSPPYWGLRDYGPETITVWDEQPGCEHEWGKSFIVNNSGGGWNNPETRQNYPTMRLRDPEKENPKQVSQGNFCQKCPAWRGALGLEPTFELYIRHLCSIFDEIKRVLRKDGTCWVNLGDSYASVKSRYSSNTQTISGKIHRGEPIENNKPDLYYHPYMQDKSLCLIPERFAIEMVNRGWIARNKIIWYKRNCMPQSASDRFTVDFEPVFFFTKNNEPIYWINATTKKITGKKPPGTKEGKEAIDWEWRDCPICTMLQEGANTKRENCRRCEGNGKIKITLWESKDYYFEQQFEPQSENTHSWYSQDVENGIEPVNEAKQESKELNRPGYNDFRKYTPQTFLPLGRNKRTVWQISTEPTPEAHFATFPQKLVETPIKAGCPEYICTKCGKPKEKIIESPKINSTEPFNGKWNKTHKQSSGSRMQSNMKKLREQTGEHDPVWPRKFIGYTDCDCRAPYEPGIVLDPFMGAGTTAIVARKLNRNYLGIELNEQYIKIAKSRMSKELGMFA